MTPSSPKKNRRWVWVIVVMIGMGLLGAVILGVFNWRQQLKPEQLAAARKLWNDKGPRNYTMAYSIKRNAADETDHYVVKVRDGRVVSSEFNGRPEDPARFAYRGMDRLFDDIERFMRLDSEPGQPRHFVRAIFDDQTNGGLRWYVRSVTGTRILERVEITVDSVKIDKT